MVVVSRTPSKEAALSSPNARAIAADSACAGRLIRCGECEALWRPTQSLPSPRPVRLELTNQSHRVRSRDYFGAD